jgi:hypothetical protein
MNALRCVAASVLVAAVLPAVAESRIRPFTHFGSPAAIVLSNDGATASVSFGHRSDELATRATLRIRYTYSTALAPGASQVRLVLNGETIGNLPVSAQGAGRPLVRELDFDPRLIVGWNKLTLVLAAAAGTLPPDPKRPGLWAEIGGDSELEMALQPLAMSDDLALLPEPFFDRHDERRVTVPFVFAARPSIGTLRAAAIVASWVGQLASWRDARFPAQLDAASPGHSIAFITNAERPASLAGLPAAAGPEVRMTTNPADGRSKLLVVSGRDAQDLRVAAVALASGKTKLSGPAASIARADEAPPALPYVAKAFAPVDGPVRFTELADSPSQLQSSGRAGALAPVRVEFRIPPDLAPAGGPGAPVMLKLQYTAPACALDANLDVSVNDSLLQTLRLPLAAEPVSVERALFIPGSRLAGRMDLALGFRFAADGACADAPARAAVLGESTIDFSRLPHYARMPNLAYFASVGYPFTRMADLSETVVVLPAAPVAGDIDTMLALMGRMGEATGEAATRVRLATSRDQAALAGADLLVIGAAPAQSLIDKWAGAFPVSPRADASPVSSRGMGPVAAAFGFESPVSARRSVVAVTAIAPDQVIRVVDALDRKATREAFGGSAAFIFPDKVESLAGGRTYTVGAISPWVPAGYWAEDHPVVVSVLAAMVLASLTLAAWGATRKVSAWRAARRPA